MAYTPKTVHSGTRHDGYSTKDANDLSTLITDIDTALETAGDITALTDNSGGTAGDTIAAIGATYDQDEVRNAVASLAAKINAIIAAVAG